MKLTTGAAERFRSARLRHGRCRPATRFCWRRPPRPSCCAPTGCGPTPRWSPRMWPATGHCWPKRSGGSRPGRMLPVGQRAPRPQPGGGSGRIAACGCAARKDEVHAVVKRITGDRVAVRAADTPSWETRGARCEGRRPRRRRWPRPVFRTPLRVDVARRGRQRSRASPDGSACMNVMPGQSPRAGSASPCCRRARPQPRTGQQVLARRRSTTTSNRAPGAGQAPHRTKAADGDRRPGLRREERRGRPRRRGAPRRHPPQGQAAGPGKPRNDGPRSARRSSGEPAARAGSAASNAATAGTAPAWTAPRIWRTGRPGPQPGQDRALAG